MHSVRLVDSRNFDVPRCIIFQYAWTVILLAEKSKVPHGSKHRYLTRGSKSLLKGLDFCFACPFFFFKKCTIKLKKKKTTPILGILYTQHNAAWDKGTSLLSNVLLEIPCLSKEYLKLQLPAAQTILWGKDISYMYSALSPLSVPFPQAIPSNIQPGGQH